MFSITYNGFLQTVSKQFPTREAAETWLRQVGKSELIPAIVCTHVI